ncbi:MAG TPA: hypothetical protein VFC47_05960 [Caulobacteraceae bacterium]|nr:hypothetical protein [Caulobacteraceae bacterium]
MKDMTGRQILDAIEAGLQEVGRQFERAGHEADPAAAKATRATEPAPARKPAVRRRA